MASFTDYITSEGERMLAKAVSGQKVSFTKIVIGSGYLPSGTIEKNVNAVVTKEVEIPIESVSINASDSVLITAHFSNKEIDHGFYFREKAMYMSDGTDEVLAIYGNNGSNAEYIDTAEVCIVDKKIKSVVKLSSQELANINIIDDTYEFAPIIEPDLKTINEFVKTTAAMAMRVGQRVIINQWTAYTYIGYDPTDVSCYITGANVLSDTYKEKLANGSAKGGVGASQNALYEVYGIANRALEGIALHLEDKDNPHNVTKEQVGLGDVPNVPTNDQTPTHTEATTLEKLKSGEKLSVAFGKIAKAISTLISHLSNKSNPHGVTKAQVGLGSVPNVATNDQTPTYTAASSNANLTSGEKLSVAFGKIAKAISSLISHLANTSNPHSVNKAQVGLGNADDKSSETIRSEITKTNVTDALGYTPATQFVASTSSNGLMSSADKNKLNGIATGANKTSIANNLTTTSSGYALDARQGKEIDGRLLFLESTSKRYPSGWQAWSYVLNGYITGDAKTIVVGIPITTGATNSKPTVASFKVNIRGINGYLGQDSFSSDGIEYVGKSGITIGIGKCGSDSNCVLKINSTTPFSHATNNTPVSIEVIFMQIDWS